jgi:acyl-coenzyme A synthetase/AMP-(fatty) acid ligase
MDEEGYVYLLGRKDDIINIGGKKVAPAEIESLLNDHPLISESACAGIPKEGGITGDTLTAFIVPEEPTTPVKLHDIVEYLRPRLESFKIPESVIIVEEIPKTSSGKIKRDKLKKR